MSGLMKGGCSGKVDASKGENKKMEPKVCLGRCRKGDAYLQVMFEGRKRDRAVRNPRQDDLVKQDVAVGRKVWHKQADKVPC